VSINFKNLTFMKTSFYVKKSDLVTLGKLEVLCYTEEGPRFKVIAEAKQIRFFKTKEEAIALVTGYFCDLRVEIVEIIDINCCRRISA